jgi:hypothetical protein
MNGTLLITEVLKRAPAAFHFPTTFISSDNDFSESSKGTLLKDSGGALVVALE